MEKRKVLLIGGGGREAAIAWHIDRTCADVELHATPGNPGIAEFAACHSVKADDLDALCVLGKSLRPDLTIVGPEAPLVAGIVDRFDDELSLSVVGPNAAAAFLEGSKVRAKRFMRRHGIPTAPFHVFDNPNSAERYLESVAYNPVVIKADGLCGGKGVIIPHSLDSQFAAVAEIMRDKRFGPAGDRIVIEKKLEGVECSLLVLADGVNAIPFPAARDFKRRFDGDKGPNTGGMGCFCPIPDISPDLLEEIMDDIVYPTIRGMAYEGHPYRGVLYFGLMLTEDGPKVLEYNCRFGDPETEVILPILTEDWNFVDLLGLTLEANSGLETVELKWQGVAVGVVAVHEGYPGKSSRGVPVDVTNVGKTGSLVFHAGTKLDTSGNLVTDGGRIAVCVGLGKDFRTAREQSYGGIALLDFEGRAYRDDIAEQIAQSEPI
ncbi:MAG: phosphoribosylamine--glycine ligase [Parcubacteria group bacterium Gr01-1014_20]|nr:MAG: phosphoribosylamine--glycine ligase [Parcubacteria group bacterium Gr01-1014_20]